ncbi:MAG: hypothetical protein IKY67_06680 [Paludibacteraceae bacterium]|nr:hypothetical protein [Paludibacteraceae bacterium]
MKEKCFEILKENLLLQATSRSNTFDHLVELSIDLYCELSNIDKEQFRNKIKDIKIIAWDNYNGDIKKFMNHQSFYEDLINGLKEKGHA